MPYLGSTPNASFSSRTKQDFTANGSTTEFTLSSAVASANDIEVFVGNVRQEPTDAYTVNGTTLTMSAAPANGINFYVVFKGLEENSVVPADNTISSAKLASNLVLGGNLTVDNDFKFISGAVPQLGIGTLTPNRKLVVSGNNSSGAEISLTNTDMTADKRTMNFYMSGDKANMRILNDAGSAGVNAIEFNSDGYVTKPSQVSFYAGWATTSSPPSGFGAVNYATGFSRVGWNVGSGWDSAGTFTAPVAGKYFMFLSMGFTSGAYNMHVGFYINGGGGTTAQGNSNGDPWQQTGRGNDGSGDQDHVMVSRIFNLNANDTLKPVYLIFDNDNNSQIFQNRSFVGGYLLG